jgi:hypothetical protein
MKKPARLILFLVLFCSLVSHGHGSELNWVAHWLGEEGREQLVWEVAKEFRFLYPDIDLNMEFVKTLPNEGINFKWKSALHIVEMINAGAITTDVVYLDAIVYSHVAELLNDPDWGEKHLLDVSEQPWFQKSQKDFILSSPYYREQTGGLLVGPYIEGFFTFLWQNQETAGKIGIEIKDRGMTLDDFFSYAEQLAEYNQRHNTSIPLIKLCSWNRLDILFEYLFKSLCDDPYFAIETKYHPTKERLFLETLRVFEKLSTHKPALNADHENLRMDKWIREFLDGDGLFIVAGSYMYSHFLGIYPEKYNNAIPVEPPAIKYSNGVVGDFIPTYAVMKKSPHRDAALNLLKLWSEPKIADRWVAYTKNPTGLKGHLQSPVSDVGGNNVYSRYIQDMSTKYSHLPMRYFRAPTYIFGDKNPVTPNDLRASLAQILLGKMTAQEYYDDVTMRFRSK